MKARLAVSAVALLTLVATPRATAQILPPAPPLPAPPEELRPLLELLAPVGGVVSSPGCAAVGTFLGLGAVVIPGLPGTVEQSTGLPLSGLPIDLQPELLSFVDTILFIQGSGCGLLPLAAERTVCATDDDISAQAQQVRTQLNLPGLPVQVGDFVPLPEPTAGAIVDTFRVLASLGLPGAAEVVAAFNDVGDCGLRSRFTNVEPPPVPETPTPPPVSELPTPESVAPAPLPGASAPPFSPAPALPRSPILEAAPVVAAPAAPASSTALPIALPEALPRWLQALAVLALIAFLYRAIAPPSSS